MVGSRSNHECDRGQLLLIGAISIAFILLGVVVVFNGVQYTETVNSGESSEDLEEIRIVESELRTGLQMIDNNETGGVNEAVAEEYINETYRESKSRQRPVYISVISANYGNDSVTIRFTTKDVTVTRKVNW